MLLQCHAYVHVFLKEGDSSLCLQTHAYLESKSMLEGHLTVLSYKRDLDMEQNITFEILYT